MTSLPLLPVPANWLDSLLTDTATTRTVTVVFEPIPLNKAAAAANRELTSIESSHEEKARRGFRVTARERRRLADVEARERELARGHPEFRHAGLVTVTRRVGGRVGRRLRPDRERGRQVADRSATAGRPPGPGMGGVAAVGPVVPAEAAVMARAPAPTDAPQRTGPGRPARRRAPPPSARRAARPSSVAGPAVAAVAAHGAPGDPGRLAPLDDGPSVLDVPVPRRPRVRGGRGLLRDQRHRRPRRVLLRPVRVLRRRASSRTRT